MAFGGPRQAKRNVRKGQKLARRLSRTAMTYDKKNLIFVAPCVRWATPAKLCFSQIAPSHAHSYVLDIEKGWRSLKRARSAGRSSDRVRSTFNPSKKKKKEKKEKKWKKKKLFVCTIVWQILSSRVQLFLHFVHSKLKLKKKKKEKRNSRRYVHNYVPSLAVYDRAWGNDVFVWYGLSSQRQAHKRSGVACQLLLIVREPLRRYIPMEKCSSREDKHRVDDRCDSQAPRNKPVAFVSKRGNS